MYFPEKSAVWQRKIRKIVAVTAAMPDGTGLKRFSKEYPTAFRCGNRGGTRGYLGGGYGGSRSETGGGGVFVLLQRAYDQVIHDVCIQNLPVVFCVDRAGLVGSDGETHQGIFDPTFLLCAEYERDGAKTAGNWKRCCSLPSPTMDRLRSVIREGEAYRGLKEFLAPVEYGVSEMLYEERGTALAVGSMVSTAEHIREKLKSAGQPCTLVNGRFVKPMDTDVIDHPQERTIRS